MRLANASSSPGRWQFIVTLSWLTMFTAVAVQSAGQDPKPPADNPGRAPSPWDRPWC